MNLQTQISIQKEIYNSINYESKILLLGSCFSENIGNKLAYYSFNQSKTHLEFYSIQKQLKH